MIVVSYIRKDKRRRTPWDPMIHHIDYASPAILRRINRQSPRHGKIVIETGPRIFIRPAHRHIYRQPQDSGGIATVVIFLQNRTLLPCLQYHLSGVGTLSFLAQHLEAQINVNDGKHGPEQGEADKDKQQGPQGRDLITP